MRDLIAGLTHYTFVTLCVMFIYTCIFIFAFGTDWLF